MTHITLLQAGWCYLYTHYDLNKGANRRPDGSVEGTYGSMLEERSTLWPTKDIYYGCLAERDGSRYKISRDYRASSVYPERLFAYGEDADSRTALSFEQLAALLGEIEGARFASSRFDPCILPRGFAKGAHTWHNAMRANADFGPTWYIHAQEIISKKVPLPAGWQMEPPYRNGPRCIEIYIDQPLA